MLPRALLGLSTRLKDLSLGLKPKQDGSDDCGDPAMSNINLLGLQQHLGLIWGYFLPSDKPSVPAAPGVVSHPRSCRNGSVPCPLRGAGLLVLTVLSPWPLWASCHRVTCTQKKAHVLPRGPVPWRTASFQPPKRAAGKPARQAWKPPLSLDPTNLFEREKTKPNTTKNQKAPPLDLLI